MTGPICPQHCPFVPCLYPTTKQGEREGRFIERPCNNLTFTMDTTTNQETGRRKRRTWKQIYPGFGCLCVGKELFSQAQVRLKRPQRTDYNSQWLSAVKEKQEINVIASKGMVSLQYQIVCIGQRERREGKFFEKGQTIQMVRRAHLYTSSVKKQCSGLALPE